MVPPDQIICNCFFGAMREEGFGRAQTDHALKACEVSPALRYHCTHCESKCGFGSE